MEHQQEQSQAQVSDGDGISCDDVNSGKGVRNESGVTWSKEAVVHLIQLYHQHQLLFNHQTLRKWRFGRLFKKNHVFSGLPLLWVHL